MIRYIHRPFTVEGENVKASCDKDGKVTFVQVNVHEGEEVEDIIIIPASFVYTVANMLKDTVKRKLIADGEEVKV